MGIISVIGGLTFSAYYDTPTGPSVVIVNAVLFLFSLFLSKVGKI